MLDDGRNPVHISSILHNDNDVRNFPEATSLLVLHVIKASAPGEEASEFGKAHIADVVFLRQ